MDLRQLCYSCMFSRASIMFEFPHQTRMLSSQFVGQIPQDEQDISRKPAHCDNAYDMASCCTTVLGGRRGPLLNPVHSGQRRVGSRCLFQHTHWDLLNPCRASEKTGSWAATFTPRMSSPHIVQRPEDPLSMTREARHRA
jgi:hypothetical protein